MFVAENLRRSFLEMICAVLLLLVLSYLSASPHSVMAQAKTTTPCAAAEYHQFDFWLGDWDVFEANAQTPAAHVKVSRLLDGCAILEEYEQADGLSGRSISAYDPHRGGWHQSWFTNRGATLLLDGRLENGEMRLNAVEHLDANKERQTRALWKAEAGGVRETAVRSVDGGKNWDSWFDLMFRPHTSAE